MQQGRLIEMLRRLLRNKYSKVFLLLITHALAHTSDGPLLAR
jgi:hypothetical protein